MKSVIPIVMASDKGYLACAAVAVLSLINTKSENTIYKIFILCTEKDEVYKEKIENLSRADVIITFRDISASLALYMNDLYPRAYYTKEMYFRWWIGELFPEFDKVLYLDCDIISTCDLLPLYKTDLGNAAIGGVIDFATPAVIHRIAEQLRLSAMEYINSGVLLINSVIWRSDNLKEKCIAYLTQHKELVCPDQDTLNLVCRDRIVYLDAGWNAQWHHLWDRPDNQLEEPFLSMFSSAMEAPRIIHFSSKIKPWNSPPTIYSEYFWKYAEPLGHFTRPDILSDKNVK